MKKVAVLFFAIAFLPVTAQAEWVNVYGSGDSRVIYTFHDNGDVTTSSAFRTGRGWMIFDDRGNMSMVNDYSTDSDASCRCRERHPAPSHGDRFSDRWEAPGGPTPFEPFE